MHRKKLRLATRERGIRRQNKAIIILILRCMLLVVDMRERERKCTYVGWQSMRSMNGFETAKSLGAQKKEVEC